MVHAGPLGLLAACRTIRSVLIGRGIRRIEYREQADLSMSRLFPNAQREQAAGQLGSHQGCVFVSSSSPSYLRVFRSLAIFYFFLVSIARHTACRMSDAR